MRREYVKRQVQIVGKAAEIVANAVYCERGVEVRHDEDGIPYISHQGGSKAVRLDIRAPSNSPRLCCRWC